MKSAKSGIGNRVSGVGSSIAPETRHPISDTRLLLVALILLGMSGCTYNSSGDQPETFNQKQEESVRDPMNYKPDNENTRPYDISGGGFNNFDKKSFKKDLDNVLSP